MKNKLSSIYTKTCLSLFVIVSVLLCSIFILINYDIIKRTLGLGSTIWVIEVSVYALLFIVFLGAPWVLIKDKHIKVDFIKTIVKPKANAIIELINSLLSAGVCLVILWYGIQVTISYFQRQISIVSMLEVPAYIIYICLPVGFFFLFLEFIRIMYQQVMILKNHNYLNEQRNDS